MPSRQRAAEQPAGNKFARYPGADRMIEALLALGIPRSDFVVRTIVKDPPRVTAGWLRPEHAAKATAIANQAFGVTLFHIKGKLHSIHLTDRYGETHRVNQLGIDGDQDGRLRD